MKIDKLYGAYSKDSDPECHHLWYVAGRSKPVAPYEKLIDGDWDKHYPPIAVDELFTSLEAELFKLYCIARFHWDVTLVEFPIPIPVQQVEEMYPLSLTPATFEVANYRHDKTRDPHYPLGFDVGGYIHYSDDVIERMARQKSSYAMNVDRHDEPTKPNSILDDIPF